MACKRSSVRTRLAPPPFPFFISPASSLRLDRGDEAQARFMRAGGDTQFTYAPLDQLVEQLLSKQTVGGSNPSGGTNSSRLAQRLGEAQQASAPPFKVGPAPFQFHLSRELSIDTLVLAVDCSFTLEWWIDAQICSKKLCPSPDVGLSGVACNARHRFSLPL